MPWSLLRGDPVEAGLVVFTGNVMPVLDATVDLGVEALPGLRLGREEDDGLSR